MRAHKQVRSDLKQRGMPNRHCPGCGSSEFAPRTVNDQFRAVDLRGQVFEVDYKALVWKCSACKLCWQGQEALVAKEAAYQYALARRESSRLSA